MNTTLIAFVILFAVLNITSASIIIKRANSTPCNTNDCKNDKTYGIVILTFSIILALGGMYMGFKKNKASIMQAKTKLMSL